MRHPVRHSAIFVTIAITACLFAVGCGGGIQPGSFGWEPTPTGWTGGASAIFTPTDSGGVEGKASVNVSLDGEQYAVAVDALIDERTVSVLAGWGNKTTVTSCYDGPEALPEVCTIVTPAANGEDGEVCVTLGGAALPCYVLPAADDPADGGEQGAVEPVSNPDEFGAPADGGYPEPSEPLIDAASITPSNPDPTGGSQPVTIPRAILADAGADG